MKEEIIQNETAIAEEKKALERKFHDFVYEVARSVEILGKENFYFELISVDFTLILSTNENSQVMRDLKKLHFGKDEST